MKKYIQCAAILATEIHEILFIGKWSILWANEHASTIIIGYLQMIDLMGKISMHQDSQ
jgi:hypothetical protein